MRVCAPTDMGICSNQQHQYMPTIVPTTVHTLHTVHKPFAADAVCVTPSAIATPANCCSVEHQYLRGWGAGGGNSSHTNTTVMECPMVYTQPCGQQPIMLYLAFKPWIVQGQWLQCGHAGKHVLSQEGEG